MALALVEQVGLEGFSTRKLATELGCEAMSIYHYYPSKAHLLDALFDRLIGGLPADQLTLSWRERLDRTVFAYRGMAHRNPRFFPYIALHRHNTAVGLAWLERMLTIFRDAGLDSEQTARFFRVIGYYVIGALIDETSGYAKGHSAADPVPDSVAADAYPNVAAVNPWFKPSEHEATFRLGLDALVDRVEAVAAGGGQGEGPLPAEGLRPLRPASLRARSSRSSSR